MKRKNIGYIFSLAIISILLTGIFTSSCIANENNHGKITKLENSDDIIIYRFGPDKNIEKVMTIKETADKDNAVKVAADKCEELLCNDPEMQEFIGSLEGLKLKVESKGNGIHFAVFRPMMRIKPILRASIFFRYFNDDCYTKVNNQTLAEGPHKGSILGFIGYVGFSTRLIGKTVINGYSLLRVNIK